MLEWDKQDRQQIERYNVHDALTIICVWSINHGFIIHCIMSMRNHWLYHIGKAFGSLGKDIYGGIHGIESGVR